MDILQTGFVGIMGNYLSPIIMASYIVKIKYYLFCHILQNSDKVNNKLSAVM